MEATNFLRELTIWILPVLFAITLHEAAHGWVAGKLGDKTAVMLGRVSINPVKHIDLVGTILVPILCLFIGGIIFGWAKPVPVISRNLNKPRRDMALVAAAGPLSNILMALFWAALIKISIMLNIANDSLIYPICLAGISINLILAILNLIPIPPLDGSRVLSSIISPRLGYYLSRIEPYGFFILLALSAANILAPIIGLPYKYALNVVYSLFGLS